MGYDNLNPSSVLIQWNGLTGRYLWAGRLWLQEGLLGLDFGVCILSVASRRVPGACGRQDIMDEARGPGGLIISWQPGGRERGRKGLAPKPLHRQALLQAGPSPEGPSLPSSPGLCRDSPGLPGWSHTLSLALPPSAVPEPQAAKPCCANQRAVTCPSVPPLLWPGIPCAPRCAGLPSQSQQPAFHGCTQTHTGSPAAFPDLGQEND